MAHLFNKVVKEHFDSNKFKISKLGSTKHWNVLRLYDIMDKKYYVAKGILHIEGDIQMGPKQMNTAYNNETNILSRLPSWWGLYLKDSFKSNPFRVIVTPEILNCNWSLYKGDDTLIAEKIYNQLEWLHSNKIAHNDLELKNILLSCNNKNAIIIDFEKATIGASILSMKNDYKTIIDSLKHNEKTRGIATKLEMLSAYKKRKLTRRLLVTTNTKTKKIKPNK